MDMNSEEQKELASLMKTHLELTRQLSDLADTLATLYDDTSSGFKWFSTAANHYCNVLNNPTEYASTEGAAQLVDNNLTNLINIIKDSGIPDNLDEFGKKYVEYDNLTMKIHGFMQKIKGREQNAE